MTYILSEDYYAERHYESIGHTRRLVVTPRGSWGWRCGCGARSKFDTYSEHRARLRFREHVLRPTQTTTAPAVVSKEGLFA